MVQSLLASENLKAVMTKMGILSPGEDILKKSPAFQVDGREPLLCCAYAYTRVDVTHASL